MYEAAACGLAKAERVRPRNGRETAASTPGDACAVRVSRACECNARCWLPFLLYPKL